MLRSIPLLEAGFSIKVNNVQLVISPKEKLTKQIRLYIKEFKNEIINELTSLPLNAINKVWLAKIAHCLNVSGEFLLAHKFIDEFDLKELVSVSPFLVANLIKTNPRWITLSKPDHEIEPVTVEDMAEPVEQAQQVKTNPYFNAFIDHLMRSKGACCYAAAKRYCDIGRVLKAKYEDSYNTS